MKTFKFLFRNLIEFSLAISILYFIIPYFFDTTDFHFNLSDDSFILKFQEIATKQNKINQATIFNTFVGGSLKVRILTSVTRDNIVTEAKRFFGIPFIWGGTSYNGVDCSRLTYLVYKKFNIKIPRTASKQYKLGKFVLRNELQKGDLVFFRTKSIKASHVGIYLGKGKFIHAFTSKTGVIISSIDNRYYRRRFIGGKNLFDS